MEILTFIVGFMFVLFTAEIIGTLALQITRRVGPVISKMISDMLNVVKQDAA